jgi:twitching motility two-component system response regulator PilH
VIEATARILVLEPDRSARERIAEIVRAIGRELELTSTIDLVGDGTTGWTRWSKTRPHLVIAEIMLEGLSGLALLRRIRADPGHDAAVVFVTRMAHETDRYWALRNGAQAYVTHPYEDEELHACLVPLMASVKPPKSP